MSKQELCLAGALYSYVRPIFSDEVRKNLWFAALAVTRLVVAALDSRADWSGRFWVVEETRVRTVPLGVRGEPNS